MSAEWPDIRPRHDAEPVAPPTTVDRDGQPGAAPVWLLGQDEDVVTCSLRRTPRTRSMAAVGLPADEDERDAARYEVTMAELGTTPASVAPDCPVRIRVRPARLRAA